MKSIHLLLTLAAFGLQAVWAEPLPLTVAVLDFQTSGERLAGKGPEAAILLGTQLSTAPQLLLVERQEVEKIFGEQELGLSGTVSTETAAKVGALTGAKVFITGRIFEAGAKYYLVAKIIGTETSRVFGEAATFTEPGTLDKAVAELAPKIVTLLSTQGAALVAKVETAPERLARLREALGARKRPSVAIQVTESHLGRPVIDPAIETELKLVLQQLDFEVLDAASPRQPEVRITGEGFSEPAARHGHLVSCRARVELKAVRVADGRQLLADRQTDSAVDLAEHVAGKKALENATTALLERLVRKLAE